MTDALAFDCSVQAKKVKVLSPDDFPESVTRLRDRLSTGSLKQQGCVISEADICQAVEKCQQEIRSKIDGFFSECAGRIPQFADELLAGRRKASLTDFHSRILPYSQQENLLREIRRTICLELKAHFGVARLISASRAHCGSNDDIRYIAGLFLEYRRTLLSSELAAQVGNKACKESFSALGVPSVAGGVLEKTGIGSALLNLFGCLPRSSRIMRRRGLIAQLNGLLRSQQRRITLDACRSAARHFYELYDLLAEVHQVKAGENTAISPAEGSTGEQQAV